MQHRLLSTGQLDFAMVDMPTTCPVQYSSHWPLLKRGCHSRETACIILFALISLVKQSYEASGSRLEQDRFGRFPSQCCDFSPF